MFDKSPKTDTLPEGLIEKTSSMLDELASETVDEKSQVIDKGKRSETWSEVKPVLFNDIWFTYF